MPVSPRTALFLFFGFSHKITLYFVFLHNLWPSIRYNKYIDSVLFWLKIIIQNKGRTCSMYRKIEGFAVVTGGARGPWRRHGRTTGPGGEGYDVVINYVSDRSTPVAQQLADRLKQDYGVGALPSRGDVSSYDTCRPCLTPASPPLGTKVAVLINNAGIQSNKPFQEIEPAAYQRLISDELLGPCTAPTSPCPICRRLTTAASSISLRSAPSTARPSSPTTTRPRRL